MTFDSKTNEPPSTDEALNRMAAWRSSLEELGKSIGGLREKCAQLPQEDPQEVTKFETEIIQSLYPRPVSSVEPQSLERADPLLQEINKLEHEALILRHIFGDKRLSADEYKILTEVDAELATLRLQWNSDTHPKACRIQSDSVSRPQPRPGAACEARNRVLGAAPAEAPSRARQ